MKFNLETEISFWKQQLHKHQGLEPEHIEELEDHLRSIIEQKMDEGLSESKSMEAALKRMRNMREVSAFSTANRRNPQLFITNIRFLFKILGKNRSHYLQSLMGLVIGIMLCTLTFYYCNYELNYDSFHDKGSALFRVRNNVAMTETGEIKNRRGTSFMAVADAVKNEVSQVVDASHLYNESALVIHDTDQFKIEKALYTIPSFFNMFTIPLEHGNTDEFHKPDGIFISSSLAKKLFGNQNPIGQSIEYKGMRTAGEFQLEVRGVYRDIPHNSYFKGTEVFLPMMAFKNHHSPTLRFAPVTIDQVKWRWVDFHTFVELESNADVEEVKSRIQNIYDQNRREFDEGAGRQQVVHLERVDEIHLVTGVHNQLETGTNSELIYLFYGVGFMAMVIAWINYVNMTTATSIGRSKEIGIKKALGAYRSQLIGQFLMEAILLTLLALAIAFIFIYIFADYLSGLFDITIVIGLKDLPFFGFLSLLLLAGSLIAGLYPAIVISAYNTIDVLKSAVQAKQGSLIRKTLVIFQFSIVIFLLTGSLVVHQQFQYMINEDLGIDVDRKIAVSLPPAIFRHDNFDTRVYRLAREFSGIPNVQAVTSCSSLPGDPNSWRQTLRSIRNNDETLVMFNRMAVSQDYTHKFKLNLLAGRTFNAKISSDYTEALIINKIGMEELGYTTPDSIIGKTVTFPVGPEAFKVIGVVDDFHHRSLHTSIEPLSIQFDSLHHGGFLVVDHTDADVSGLLGNLEEKFSGTFTEVPFEYDFVDNRYKSQYEADLRFQRTFGIFTLVAVILSVIGLLSLSSYFLNRQKKSISVRKILGAGKIELMTRLLREYVQLTLIAGFISIPLAYVGINKWLSGFVFKTVIPIWIYILPMLLVMVIVLLTVFNHTSKLLGVDPAKTLRND